MKIAYFVFDTFQKFLKESAKLNVTVEEIGPLSNLPAEINHLMQPGPYVPESVVDLSKIKTVYKISFIIQEKCHVTIYLAKIGARMPPFQRVIKLTKLYVYMLEQLKQLNSVTITILPFDKKKLLPASQVPIKPDNVNTGLMSRSLSGAHVLLYRTEELGKVLLHELMHLYNMDFNDTHHDQQILNQLSSLKINIKVERRLAMHEVYNDTMTILFMVGLKLLLGSSAPKTKAQFIKEYEKELAKTSDYMFMNAAKILRHYGKKSLWDAPPIHEISHAFTYFIGKAVTFATLDKFCMTVPENLLLDHQVNLYTKFTSYFMEAIQSKAFADKLNVGFALLKKNTDSAFQKSGRMSYFDV